MKKLLLFLGIISALAVSVFAQGAAPTPPPLSLKVGDTAPDFTLPSTTGGRVKLSDFRGKNNVVLAFFVPAFTGG
jgi:peroxiredoxin